MSGTTRDEAHEHGERPLRRIGLALGAGLWFAACMGLAFPPFGLWFLCLVALVGPALVLREPGRWTAVLVGVGTLPFWAYEVLWTARVSALGYVPFALALTAYAVLGFWILGRIARRWPRLPMAIVAPVAWCGVEMLRGRVAFDGYPWYFVGHPTIEFAFIAGAAASVGAIGVSVLVAALAGGIADLIAWPAWRRRSAALLVIVGSVTVALAAISLPRSVGKPGEPSLTVGVVQTNVPQSIRGSWTFEKRNQEMRTLIELTFEAVQGAPGTLDLLVWPETMFPGLGLEAEAQAAIEADGGLGDIAEFNRLMREITFEIEERTGVPMVIGATGYERPFIQDLPNNGFTLTGDREFNSAFLLESGMLTGRYDKVHLTPFGEVMPYISKWPWLERQLLAFGAAGMAFNLSEGERVRTLELARGLRIGTPICFEIANPAITRSMVRQGAQVIVTVTNDGWFGSFDSTRQQHVDLARWRSIEVGLPVVRAANTGISCVIDARGRIERAAPPREPAVVVASPGLLRAEPTIYTRIGDLVGWIVLALAGVGLGLSFVRPRAGRRTPSPADE